MECKHEDSRHVKLFWNLYNDACEEANNTTLKYKLLVDVVTWQVRFFTLIYDLLPLAQYCTKMNKTQVRRRYRIIRKQTLI